MADLRSIGTAIESYSIDNNFYPVAANIGALELPRSSRSTSALRRRMDGWSKTFGSPPSSRSTPFAPAVRTAVPARTTPVARRTSFNDSITFANGQFVQWPEGAQQ